jgi:predicted NAD/FAD-binding protein
MACHSDQALRLLADPTPLEREVLTAIPYQRNTAILHTDPSLMPRSKRAWASWNVRLESGEQPRAIVTYWMNMLQGLEGRQQFFVSLNAEDLVDPSAILGRYEYEHPIFTTARARIQQRHSELLDVNHTSYAGAYWRNGFHEDGVVSANRVAAVLNRMPCLSV